MYPGPDSLRLDACPGGLGGGGVSVGGGAVCAENFKACQQAEAGGRSLW